MNMDMDHCWNDTNRGKPVQVSVCPPEILNGLTFVSKPGLRGDRPETNRLNHSRRYPHENSHKKFRKVQFLTVRTSQAKLRLVYSNQPFDSV